MEFIEKIKDKKVIDFIDEWKKGWYLVNWVLGWFLFKEINFEYEW